MRSLKRIMKCFLAVVVMLLAAVLLVQPAAGATSVGAAIVSSQVYSDVTDQTTGDDSQRPVVIPSVPHTTHIIVPGTDDADGADQLGRMAGWFANGEHVMLVNYPATIGPIIGGVKAPTYDESRDQGVLNTLIAVKDIDGHVTIYGYSQGAEAAGNATELIYQLGLKSDEDVSLVLLADPRFPDTGTKPQLKAQHPVVSFVLKSFFGVETNGERDPAETGNIQVTSVAIMGDPVTSLETWYLNPLGFIINTPTGFFMVHSGLGAQSASNADELPVLISWQDGKTEYVVLDATHPLVQTLEYIGLPVSDRGERWIEFIVPLTIPGQKAARAPGVIKTLAFIKSEVEIAREERGYFASPVVDDQALAVESPLVVADEEAPVETPVLQPSSSQSEVPTAVKQDPVAAEISNSVVGDSRRSLPIESDIPSDDFVAKEEEPSTSTEVDVESVEAQAPKVKSVLPNLVTEPTSAPDA